MNCNHSIGRRAPLGCFRSGFSISKTYLYIGGKSRSLATWKIAWMLESQLPIWIFVSGTFGILCAHKLLWPARAFLSTYPKLFLRCCNREDRERERALFTSILSFGLGIVNICCRSNSPRAELNSFAGKSALVPVSATLAHSNATRSLS